MPIDDVKLMHYVDGTLSEEERSSIKRQIDQDPQLQKKVKILELTTRDRLKNAMGEMSDKFSPEVEKKLQSIEKNFSIKKLNDCIGKLPEKYREAIVLFKEGYSYNEIAEQIKTDLGKIHNYIYRARINLAECMQLGGIGHAH